jgi:hypothetical protein
MAYAESTNVGIDRSRAEIEQMLQRHGVERFGSFTDRGRAALVFEIDGLSVRIEVVMPERNEERFRATPKRRTTRSASQAFAAWEQECRRRWRSLAAVIKAKLIAIEDGVATVEQEFLPYVICANGQTVSEQMLPHLEDMRLCGRKTIPALPDLSTSGPGLKREKSK